MWSSSGYTHMINEYINKSKLYFVIPARQLRLGRISFLCCCPKSDISCAVCGREECVEASGREVQVGQTLGHVHHGLHRIKSIV